MLELSETRSNDEAGLPGNVVAASPLLQAMPRVATKLVRGRIELYHRMNPFDHESVLILPLSLFSILSIPLPAEVGLSSRWT